MSDIKTAYMGTLSLSRLVLRATSFSEQTTNAQRSISSTSASDTAAGVGARTIELFYLDENFNGPYSEVLTLNGTTPVDTVATNICLIERIEVLEVGSTGPSVGTIRLHSTTGGGGSVIASIPAGDGRTRYSHHYIPAGKNMYLQSISCSCTGLAYLVDASIRKYAIPIGSTVYATRPVVAPIRVDPNSPPSVITFTDPYQITGPAKFELYARCDLVTAGTIYADYSYYET